MPDATARTTIDAKGEIVAPGFIDMLGQSELNILVAPSLPSKIYQGITTEITGEGDSIAPLDDRIIENNQAGYKHRGITPTWRTLDGYFARLEKQGIGINLGTYDGATSIRRMVLGDDDVQPTPAQLQRPNQLAQGMDYVIVNGTLVIADGKMTHALPGKVLRGPEYVAGN